MMRAGFNSQVMTPTRAGSCPTARGRRADAQRQRMAYTASQSVWPSLATCAPRIGWRASNHSQHHFLHIKRTPNARRLHSNCTPNAHQQPGIDRHAWSWRLRTAGDGQSARFPTRAEDWPPSRRDTLGDWGPSRHRTARRNGRPYANDHEGRLLFLRMGKEPGMPQSLSPIPRRGDRAPGQGLGP
jgi:hypothetical protein